MDDTQTADPAPPQTDAPTAVQPVDNAEVARAIKAASETARQYRRNKYHQTWETNVQLRLGEPTTIGANAAPTEDQPQTVINPDWALTKTKTANLYSQVPSVQITHENVQYAPAIPPFAKALNYELSEKRTHVAVAMEEVLNDVVNAAGVGAVFVNYLARFEDVEIPAVETIPGPQGPIPTQGIPIEQLKAQGIPTTTVPRPVSTKFSASRIAPTSLLWPKPFTGSCFDDADWIGYDGKLRWADAKHVFGLTEDQKEDCCGVGDTQPQDTLRTPSDLKSEDDTDLVTFSDHYYWRHRVDPNETSFQAIWRIVFVKGIDDPVVHEPWQGQRYDPQARTYVGNCKFPIRVLTLTYVSDHPVPPSDSQAGRPQVQDLQRSRQQMFLNRLRSIPVRWFNSNLIDLDIQTALMQGTWQGWIPLNGSGERAIGEVARPSFPQENLEFDRTAKADLNETWQVGPNQGGNFGGGRQTKGEAEIVQANFSTNIGRERARVMGFFLGICEVLAGWMALYSDFPSLSDQERQAMRGAWDNQRILHDLVFKIRPNAMIVLDPQQRVQQLERVINFLVKSGYVNPQPLIAEYLELNDLDPSAIMIQPQPHVDEPQLSYRFSGKDDLTSPAVVALLDLKGELPKPENLDHAKAFLAKVQEIAPPPPPTGPPGMPGPTEGGAAPAAPPPPAGGPHVPHPAALEDVHPHWNTPSKIVDRSRDANA